MAPAASRGAARFAESSFAQPAVATRYTALSSLYSALPRTPVKKTGSSFLSSFPRKWSKKVSKSGMQPLQLPPGAHFPVQRTLPAGTPPAPLWILPEESFDQRHSRSCHQTHASVHKPTLLLVKCLGRILNRGVAVIGSVLSPWQCVAVTGSAKVSSPASQWQWQCSVPKPAHTALKCVV